jgi:(1->4)-alpha-D-glucan 1-alpha-D-glucosylmutase
MAARRAAYRLQLHAEFGLDDAAELVPYLAALGVSHVYASPLLQAVPGSRHGYDVVDPGRVSRELGGEEALRRLGARLAEHGMGLLVDVVPNHMAVHRDNAWWWDVLENGPASPWARCFDVDWEPPEARLRNLVLVPVLADHYGRVLEAGELRVERREGSFRVRHHEHVLPVSPRSYDALLGPAASGCGSPELAYLADAFAELPSSIAADDASRARRQRDAAVLRAALARLLATRPEAAAAVDAAVEATNADADLLHALLERQNWRLARWRSGERDLGYRRFFDVDELVALRVEDPLVFAAVYATLLGLRDAAAIDGLRVDHVDGLRDPGAHLERLRAAAPDAWLLVEKILARGERLPDAWPVEGTTGYDFLALAGGLLVDPSAEAALDDAFAAFTGEKRPFAAVVREAKAEVLSEGLAADLGRLTALLLAVCERHRRYRDFTRHELHEALRACVVELPVYRTYVRVAEERVRDEDARRIAAALAAAARAAPELDRGVFELLEAVLLRRLRGPLEDEVVMRFQQLTGPAQAKGVEDTAFYRYARFAASCEVGDDPGRLGTSLAGFHAWCADTAARRPETLLASSTHDTKRGEDVRARLYLLSEIPDAFAEAVRGWARLNEPHRSGGLPDRGLELLFYQTLVGAWPIETPRVLAYLEKAAREAKRHTSWTRPDPRYEDALRRFAERSLASPAFARSLEGFVAGLVAPGRANALALALLKLTAPGVPDVYQGCELWESSLVDPDNRRPVDYARRRALLGELHRLDLGAIRRRADEGLPKLWLVRQALDLRRRRPGWFGAGAGYEPLPARGERAEHVVAYARAGRAVAVSPRLVLRLERAGGFGDAELTLPPGEFRDVLSGRGRRGGPVRVAELLADFPVALLEAQGS